MIGSRLSHYLLQEEIGAGGMGVVYRARDERLERDVAIKVLPAGSLDETTRARFRREALALSRLNHPHIGMIHDFGSDQGTDFLVMELVRGKTLRQRLKEGAFPFEETVEIGLAVADALEEAHDQGVVHRDLKPENVLQTTKGWVKVLDFGLAALRASSEATVVTETLTAAHMLTGTLPYMAPEQLLGKQAGPRTDVYALGVLLYELATGSRPFEAQVQAALIGEILHKKAAAPSSRRAEIPLWFDGVVMRCLEKEPAGRFDSAAALKAALKAGMKGGGAAGGAAAGAGAGTGPGAPSSSAGAPIVSPPLGTPFRTPSPSMPSPPATPSPWTPLATPPSGGRPIVTPPSGTHSSGIGPAHPPTPVSGFPHAAGGQSVNPEVYDAVLRGRQIIGRRTEESVRRGIEYFRRAIEIDPLYPPAYAALATAYDLMGFFAMASPADCFPRARVAASRAIELDPNWAPAYASLAYVQLYYEWDFRISEENFRRSIELDPQYSIGPLWYANLLLFEKRFDEAEAALKRSQTLDPLSSIITMSNGWTWWFRREPARAVLEYKRALDFDPDFHVAHWMGSWCLTEMGRHDEAIVWATRAIEVSKGLMICYPTLVRAHALAGHQDEARRILAEVEAQAPSRYVDPLELGIAYESIGERDAAFAWFDRALEGRAHWLVALEVDPRFDSMRGDPRFGELVKRVGVFGG